MNRIMLATTVLAVSTVCLLRWKPYSQDIYSSAIVAPSYTVSIPTAVQLGEKAVITANDITLDEGDQILVSITKTSDKYGRFALTHKDEDRILMYKVTQNGENIETGKAFLTASAGETKTAELEFSKPLSHPYPGEYSGYVEFTIIPQIKKNDSIAFPGMNMLTATTFSPTVTTDRLYNPETNPCTFVYELVIDGETLFTSEPLAPGEKLDSFTMSKTLPAGDYPAEFRIHTYALDSGAALNSSVIKFELRVKEG